MPKFPLKPLAIRRAPFQKPKERGENNGERKIWEPIVAEACAYFLMLTT